MKLTIGGGEIIKVRSATYLGMTISSNGIGDELNIARGQKSAVKARQIATAVKLQVNSPAKRIRTFLHIFLRISYLHNAMLLRNTERLEKLDKEVHTNLFKVILKSRDRSLPDKALDRLGALYKITPIHIKLEQDAGSFIKKTKRQTEEEI